jgi:tetratricopeptide (TPR) repeat protein
LCALTSFVIALGLATAPSPAHAGRGARSKIAREAKHHTKAGIKLYEAKEYDAAIEELLIAYGLSPKTLLLFYIAQAYQAKQDYAPALYYYKSYLEQDPKGAAARKVDATISALEAATATPEPVEPETPPPEPEPLPVIEPPASPPRPEVVATRRTAPPGSPGRGKRIAGLVTAAGGVVLVGAGAYFAKVASDRADEISELFDTGGRWTDDYARTFDEGRSAERMSIVLTAAGGAALVTGVVLVYLGWRDGRSHHVEVAPTVSQVGAGVSVTCAF